MLYRRNRFHRSQVPDDATSRMPGGGARYSWRVCNATAHAHCCAQHEGQRSVARACVPCVPCVLCVRTEIDYSVHLETTNNYCTQEAQHTFPTFHRHIACPARMRTGRPRPTRLSQDETMRAIRTGFHCGAPRPTLAPLAQGPLPRCCFCCFFGKGLLEGLHRLPGPPVHPNPGFPGALPGDRKTTLHAILGCALNALPGHVGVAPLPDAQQAQQKQQNTDFSRNSRV